MRLDPTGKSWIVFQVGAPQSPESTGGEVGEHHREHEKPLKKIQFQLELFRLLDISLWFLNVTSSQSFRQLVQSDSNRETMEESQEDLRCASKLVKSERKPWPPSFAAWKRSWRAWEVGGWATAREGRTASAKLSEAQRSSAKPSTAKEIEKGSRGSKDLSWLIHWFNLWD